MKPFSRVVLWTGLVVGTTDLISAYVQSYIRTGKFAYTMLQFIAGGAIGLERALKGGIWTSLLGLFFHYCIAVFFTWLFFMIYPKLKLQHLNKYILWTTAGLLYAILVDTTMRLIVLPLSKLPPGRPLTLTNALITWLILALMLGIPIVISAWRFELNYRYK